MLVLCQKLHICTYMADIFFSGNRLHLQTVHDPILPSPSGDARRPLQLVREGSYGW